MRSDMGLGPPVLQPTGETPLGILRPEAAWDHDELVAAGRTRFQPGFDVGYSEPVRSDKSEVFSCAELSAEESLAQCQSHHLSLPRSVGECEADQQSGF